jgi:Uma2 family endonuclease
VTTNTRATIDVLRQVPENGKAEWVDGRLVDLSPTGARPNRAAGNIYLSLRRHERNSAVAYAYSDNAGFLVDLPQRRSFSPDAAWHRSAPKAMSFLEGAPLLAVEVRSDCDYGDAAEAEMARKRADYFAAGTLVVWDVDLIGPDTIRCYRATDPTRPQVFRRGETADAEPAVSGWRFPVDELFD